MDGEGIEVNEGAEGYRLDQECLKMGQGTRCPIPDYITKKSTQKSTQTKQNRPKAAVRNCYVVVFTCFYLVGRVGIEPTTN